MLAIFPDPYPDELLYSVCARYSDRLEYPNTRSLISEIFGARSALAVIDLPSRLTYLQDHLPPGHHRSVDRIIDGNTLLPFYARFLPQERLKRIREQMKANNGVGISYSVGKGTFSTSIDWFRFCPLCAERDRQIRGEFYWHRLHQIPGVEVCPIHNIFLSTGQK